LELETVGTAIPEELDDFYLVGCGDWLGRGKNLIRTVERDAAGEADTQRVT
jgi:hypothetical protein